MFFLNFSKRCFSLNSYNFSRTPLPPSKTLPKSNIIFTKTIKFLKIASEVSRMKYVSECSPKFLQIFLIVSAKISLKLTKNYRTFSLKLAQNFSAKFLQSFVLSVTSVIYFLLFCFLFIGFFFSVLPE